MIPVGKNPRLGTVMSMSLRVTDPEVDRDLESDGGLTLPVQEALQTEANTVTIGVIQIVTTVTIAVDHGGDPRDGHQVQIQTLWLLRDIPLDINTPPPIIAVVVLGAEVAQEEVGVEVEVDPVVEAGVGAKGEAAA